MTVQADLIEDMRFCTEAGLEYILTLDAAEQSGGTGAGFVPMELLLVALAGCIGMDVISILRKMCQDVMSYQVRVSRERASEHPMVFTEITVEHLVTGHGACDRAIGNALLRSRRNARQDRAPTPHL